MTRSTMEDHALQDTPLWTEYHDMRDSDEYAESGNPLDDFFPPNGCIVDVRSMAYADSDEEGKPTHGGEDEDGSSVSEENVPEVILMEQDLAPPSPRSDDGPDGETYGAEAEAEAEADEEEEEEDPLSTDHLQVEVIEIGSSDEEKNAQDGERRKTNGDVANDGNSGKTSEVDENSNSEWDFYSYLVNMDAEENGGDDDKAQSNAKRYVCYDCGFQTNRSDKFSEHVRTAHEDDVAATDRADADEETDGRHDEGDDVVRWEDVQVRQRPRPLPCPHCPFEARGRPALTRHVRAAHAPGPQQSAATVSAAAAMAAVAQREVKFHCCDRCPYKTKWKHHIKEHYMFHHNEGEIEWHKCPLCDYQTKWKYHIKQHLKAKHADGREADTFACPAPACRFQTRWKPHFQRHLRQEHGPAGGASSAARTSPSPADKEAAALRVRVLACPHCRYSTPNRAALTAHLRTQHGGPRRQHQQQQQQQMQFMQMQQGQGQGQQRQQELHQCERCGFRTRWKHHLKNHWLMKHQENAVLPVFRCGECSYESKWKHHVKIHRENKHARLPCPGCPFVAHTKLEMRQHSKTCRVPLISAVSSAASAASVSALAPAAAAAAGGAGPRYPWPWSQLMAATTGPRGMGAALQCSQCGFRAAHPQALEQHARIRHRAFHLPVLLRLPLGAAPSLAAAAPGAANVAAAGFGPALAASLGNGALMNGARMQVPVLLRLPVASGTTLPSCFRVDPTAAGGGGGVPTRLPGGPIGEAPLVLLRCSDCGFQTASVDGLRDHAAVHHPPRLVDAQAEGGAARGDDDDEDEDDGDAVAGAGSETSEGGNGYKCGVCGERFPDVGQLGAHSRAEHGRTLLVNGGSVSLLPPEISVTPVVQPR